MNQTTITRTPLQQVSDARESAEQVKRHREIVALLEQQNRLLAELLAAVRRMGEEADGE